ncbi:putative Secreted Protein [Cryptosporidium hominis]|uniref:Secreted Protein n=1 Tax=Cryptosporidium hominis TaxID=237895 RepID=A0ABX5BIX3_CRYHO|nr:putative Secreted Protein [Cryptosporidium hominis]|eukprot:PPS98322.1 putative Secreted Protein [Cryptosporidium hominis]
MFKKTLIILALLAILVGVCANNYVSPRQVRLSRIQPTRTIEPDHSGVYTTPNLKPSDLELKNKIFGTEDSTSDLSSVIHVVLKEEAPGSFSIQTSGAQAFTKDALFYYPLISPTKRGIVGFCEEDIKLIDNIEKTLLRDAEPIITSLPDTEAKKVYSQVLFYMKSLCRTQREKLSNLSASVSDLSLDDEVNESIYTRAFVIAKEDDILVSTTFMLIAHASPNPIPGKSPETPRNLDDLKNHLKEQRSLIESQLEYIERNHGRIDKIPMLYQRQHAQRTREKLVSDIKQELDVFEDLFEELSTANEVTDEVFSKVESQSQRIDEINANSLALGYHIDKYSPLLPRWARDQTKDPFIVESDGSYGVIMSEPNKDLLDFHRSVVVKRAEEGDKEAERALYILRTAVSVLEHRERTTNYSALQFFTTLESKAMGTLSKPSMVVDPNGDFSTNEFESDVDDSSAREPSPVVTPNRKLAEATSDIEDDDDEMPNVQEILDPQVSTPEEILSKVATGKAYTPAQCASISCLSGPSCISNKDGSPKMCYKATCVKKDCNHIAIHTVDCSDAKCEKGSCKCGNCVGGECKPGKCVGGSCHSGSCSSTKCVGCTTEVPRLEGCVARPAHCTGGSCSPAKVRGARCVKREILPNHHCAKEECSKGECVKGECKKGKCVAGDCSHRCYCDECVAPKCQPGSCTPGTCTTGSCNVGESQTGCEKGSCKGGYCVGPKCNGNEYDGFKCKGSECTPAKCHPSCNGCSCTTAKCTGGECTPARCVGGKCGRVHCDGCSSSLCHLEGAKCVPARCRGVKAIPARIVGYDGRTVGSCSSDYYKSRCVGKPNCKKPDYCVREKPEEVCTAPSCKSPGCKGTNCDGSKCKGSECMRPATTTTTRSTTTTTRSTTTTTRPTTTTTRSTTTTRPTTTTTRSTTTTTRPTTTTTRSTTTTTRSTTTTTRSTTTTTRSTTTTTRPTTTTTRPTTTTTRPTTTTTTTTTTTSRPTTTTTTTTTRPTTTTTTTTTTTRYATTSLRTSTTTVSSPISTGPSRRILAQVPDLGSEKVPESKKPESKKPESKKPESRKPESKKPESKSSSCNCSSGRCAKSSCTGSVCAYGCAYGCSMGCGGKNGNTGNPVKLASEAENSID